MDHLDHRTLSEVMTPNPVILDPADTCLEAANAMQARDIGCVVLAEEDGHLCGIVTDRDLVVRVMAAGRDPHVTTLGDICSPHVVSLEPRATVDEAIRTMGECAVRRVPVVENGTPVGVVSLGDLAIARDPRSVLGKVSAAPPNN
jgi:CBS domain-containing protein